MYENQHDEEHDGNSQLTCRSWSMSLVQKK